jgi:4-hydroxy-tetrahydrodipicolinate reductase
MTLLAVGIAGSDGRMGRTLVESVHRSPDLRLSAALEQPGSPAIGRDAGAAIGLDTGVIVTDDVARGLPGCEVLIDFTRPAGTRAHLALCERMGVGMVIGTTGLSVEDRAAIEVAARRIGIVFAPNMSVGVNLAFKLVEMAARVLGPDYDAEVIEAHHRHKVDAPSGTALRLGEKVAAGRGVSLENHAVYAREGQTGERTAGAIGFATVRGGDIVGDHTVLFAGIGERFEITHRAASRETFAQGALRAARFLKGRAPGLFDMQDVLGLR